MFRILLFAPVVVVALLGSCSSSPPPPPPSSVDLTGTWMVHSEVVAASGACAGEIGTTEDSSVTIAQDASGNLTVTAPGAMFTGSISGSVATVTGTNPDSDGTTNSVITLNVSEDGNMMSGTDAWSYSDDSDNCTGETSLTATRVMTLQAGEAHQLSVSNPTGANKALFVRSTSAGADGGVIAPDLVVRPGESLLVEGQGILSVIEGPASNG